MIGGFYTMFRKKVIHFFCMSFVALGQILRNLDWMSTSE